MCLFHFYTLSSPPYRSPPPDILQQNSLLQISMYTGDDGSIYKGAHRKKKNNLHENIKWTI